MSPQRNVICTVSAALQPLVQRREGAVLLLIALFGVVLRLRQSLYNKSLWLDELLLGREIFGRTKLDLITTPLGSAQTAPPGYLFFTKLGLELFGVSDFSLRIVPLIGSLWAIVLGFFLAKRVFTELSARYAFLLLLALSPVLVLYAAEGKQYGVDACCSLLVLLQTTYPEPMVRRWRQLIGVGLLAVLFSNPAVFLLFPLGLIILAERESRSTLRNALRALTVPASWLILFVWLLLSVYRKSFGNPTLKRFWHSGFPPHTPSISGWLEWVFGALNQLIQIGYGEALRYGRRDVSFNPLGVNQLLLLVTVLGGIQLWKRHPRLVLVGAGAICTAVVAASLRTYPFQGRLLFFLIPFLYLSVAALFLTTEPRELKTNSFIRQQRFAEYRILLITLLLGATITLSSVKLFITPLDRPQIKKVFHCVREHFGKGDRFLVGSNSQPIYDFYSSDYDIPKNARVSVRVADRLARNRDEVGKFFGQNPTRWWVVNFHQGGRFSKLVRSLRERPGVLVACEGDGAEAILIEATAPPSRAEPAP